ncbi:MAG: NAD(P)-dependent dehydrogenase, short-chain alcohol dehydrogenase family [Chloroflexi bacterium]|jgi:NAD(P)-dependent dehydrogenase (short-subunit alcohol dehydrogenase family)|nr:MAG: NAD(P)-dependent dehydrogenase, short-chain alcohol dehydrogenase family [Chloroflexota bacterium]
MTATVNPNGLLAGKVTVVTGASRGIGEAIAYRYAQEGAKVVVSARTLDDGDHPLAGSINSVVQRIRAAGGAAHAVQADLSSAGDRERLIAESVAAFGPVDILVNNAAVTFFIPTAQFPEKRYKLMEEVQVYGPLHLTQLVLDSMRARKTGWIVNVSSHAALHPALDSGGGPGTIYGMCKAALERFTTGLAAEVYADNVAINAISPGLVATPGVVFHKLITDDNKERVTPVEHMAEACLRLAYSPANEISGRITYADELIEEFTLEPAELLVPPVEV